MRTNDGYTSTFRLGRTKCPVLRQSVMLATFSKRSVMVDLELISPSRKVGFEKVKFQDQNPREMHDLSQTVLGGLACLILTLFSA
jgi:hypothetical protein